MTKTTHIGDIGTRVVVSGTVLSAERHPTEWGNGTLFKIDGAQGELAYWISSHDLADQYPVGSPITVRATVSRYKLIGEDLWVRITNGTIQADALAIV